MGPRNSSEEIDKEDVRVRVDVCEIVGNIRFSSALPAERSKCPITHQSISSGSDFQGGGVEGGERGGGGYVP